ncbi:hypothetical protein [Nocardia wallacei]|uniref:hypothetical protein n=1 Tax=Nocardia wallacei TaxID=480035 RepID=UPI002453A533|nr:hypothetical protein [Nocardia wallacei]
MEENPADRTVVPLHGRDGSRRPRRPRHTPDAADARVGDLTVSFQVRYVHGAEAERVAATQARAIAALLRWAATIPEPGVVDLDQVVEPCTVPGRDSDEEAAA